MVRIGELARRTGVSAELLRAWENRYRLLEPARSPGGFRLYSAADEQRVRRMTALIRSGLSASEAAADARLDETAAVEAPSTDEGAARLRGALDRFDSQAAHGALDQLFASTSIESVLTDVLVPYLRTLGDRWEAGEATVGQEHFASNLLRGRLLGLARDWAMGSGPVYILACPPGEEHDLALVMFGIETSRRGGRIVFLGADTPIETIADAARATGPTGVVVSVTLPGLVPAIADELATLARETPLYLCGRGVVTEDAAAIGGRVLEGDPVSAARNLV